MNRQHTKSSTNVSWLQVFFAVTACSWVPHWACHYYRLETGSSFVVGNWEFTRVDSVISMVVYSALIGFNLAAISLASVRFWAALTSGLGHSLLGGLHIFRLLRPFRSRYSVIRGRVARQFVKSLSFSRSVFFAFASRGTRDEWRPKDALQSSERRVSKRIDRSR